MTFKIRTALLVLALATPLLRVSTASALVRSGSATTVTVSNQVFSTFVNQGPTDWVTVQTSNLSPNGDTVIHVQDASDSNGSFVAGDDDFNGQLSSFVFVPATGTSRTLRVIVRSFSGFSAGTCDVTINTPTLGMFTLPNQAFGGTKMLTSTIVEASSWVQTVELKNSNMSNSDTMMLVVSGADESHAVAFNDDGAPGEPGGAGFMSFVRLPEQCPDCRIVVADFRQESLIFTKVIFDSDVAYGFDSDGDMLGDTLEGNLGTSPTAWDSDLDGISDYEEEVGIVGIPALGAPPVKFPLMGADPLQKDLFVEVDWQDCLVPAKCPTQDSAQMTSADVTNLKGEFAPLRVHFDTGVANNTPATWFDFNDWGGASRVDPGNPGNPAFCEFLSAERAGRFHHYLASLTASGHSPVGPDQLHNGQMVSACSMGTSQDRVSGHELGHQLGIGHGGRPLAIDINSKAHYVSWMNYGYEWTSTGGVFAVPGFSHGGLGQLNPVSLDETVGIRTTASGLLSALGPSQWQYTVNTAANSPLPGPIGAVDWNKDGVISPAGTTVRASISQNANSIRWDAASLAGSTYMSSTTLLNDPALGWVTVGGVYHDWLFMVGRLSSDNRLFYTHIAKDQIDAACGSRFTSLSSDSTPGASWNCANVPTPIATGLGNPIFGPAVAEIATGQLMVLHVESGGLLWAHPMSINQSSGAVTFGAGVLVSSGLTVTGDVTAVATGPGVIEAWAPVGNRLKQWLFVNNHWQSATDQTSGGVPIVPSGGIGATLGYQDGSATAHVYAAIPTQSTGTNGKIMFARQEANGTWTDLSTSSFINLPTHFAAARPGLAYQRTAGGAVSSGRFYLVWGPTGGTQQAQMTMTEGNSSTGSTKRLVWNKSWNISPLGQIAKQTGIAVVDDVNRDSNLRAVLDSVNPDGSSMTTAFAPLADGIVNANYTDMNDFTYVLGNLQASLGETTQLP